MIFLVILVTFSSVSAFICDDPTPGLHVVAEGNDEQATRDMSRGGGGGKEREA